MNRRSPPTSCLLDKNVVREALRGLVRETAGVALPARQRTSLDVIRTIIAYGGLLYITPELRHLLERPTTFSLASPLLPYLRVLRAGRYLKRWARRLAEEGFSHEDARLLSYASFGFDVDAVGVYTIETSRRLRRPSGRPPNELPFFHALGPPRRVSADDGP